MILRGLFFNTVLDLALGKEVNYAEAAGPMSRVRPEAHIALWPHFPNRVIWKKKRFSSNKWRLLLWTLLKSLVACDDLILAACVSSAFEVTFFGLKNKPGLNLSPVLISCYFFIFWGSASVALYDSQFKIILSYTGRLVKPFGQSTVWKSSVNRLPLVSNSW